MEKSDVIAAIKAQAKLNGGKPVGRKVFQRETGITEGQYTKFGNFGELQAEAGFTPNVLNSAFDEESVVGQFIDLCNLVGAFPTKQKMRQAREESPERFPSPNVFSRLGSTKEGKAASVVAWLSGREELKESELLALKVCRPLALDFEKESVLPEVTFEPSGYVYLLKDGAAYKIGSSVDPEFRRVALQTGNPREIHLVHQIVTDDPKGIENYWHRRFSARRTKRSGGTEWFDLSREDVAAFRSRTRM